MEEKDTSKIAINSMYLFARMIVVMGVTLYTSRIVINTLGFEDYGIFNVVGSIIIFFGFLRTALTNATFRFITFELGTGNIQGLRKVYSMAINSHICLAAILFFILEIIGLWFINYKLNIATDRLQAANWVFQFSLISFFISIVQTPFHSNIIAHEKMNFYASLSFVEVILRLGIVYVLKVCSFDPLILYGALTMIVTIIVFICYYFYNKFAFKNITYQFIWDSKLLKQFSSYSGWSLLVNTADVGAQQSISIFFNLFLGVIANAALGIANQVSSAVNTFLQSFVQACNPQIVKSYAAQNFSYFLKLVYSSSKISYLLLLLVAVPLLTNTEYVLTVWLGEYPEHTPVYVQLMIVYYLIDACQTALWQAMHATGNIKTHQIIIGSLKFLNIPLIYLCLYLTNSGTLSLVIWVFINFLCALARTFYMRKLINLNLKHYFFDVIVKIGLVTLFTIVITLHISSHFGVNIKGFILSGLVSTATIVLLSYFYCFNMSEKNLVKTLFLRITNRLKQV